MAAVEVISSRSVLGRARHTLEKLESFEVSARDAVRTIARITWTEFVGIGKSSLTDPELDGAGRDFELVGDFKYGKKTMFGHVRIIRKVLERSIEREF